MSNSKKTRMSMLDNLTATGAPSPTATSMMSSNRALRSARDAVDGHRVWDIDPAAVIDDRYADRLDPSDVIDLRDAIETNGQTVPILVRRHPTEADQYLLVYGRRRLEAIRSSDKVHKVRALVANIDDASALRAQISENMARRDLSFIEKALFAQELVAIGFGNQSEVAEVLTVTKSSISMAISIAETIGTDLARAIGPAHGIGRPKWEALAKAIEEKVANRERLIEVAEKVHDQAAVSLVTEDAPPDPAEVSAKAFEAVAKAVGKSPAPKAPPSPARRSRPLIVSGERGGSVRRTAKGVSLDLEAGPFADWVDAQAEELITELHARWIKRAED